MKYISALQLCISQLIFLAPAIFFHWSAIEIVTWFFLQAVLSAVIIFVLIARQKVSRISTNSNFLLTTLVALVICYSIIYEAVGEFFTNIPLSSLAIILASVFVSEVFKRIDTFKDDISRLHTIEYSGRSEWFTSNAVLFIAIVIVLMSNSGYNDNVKPFDMAAILFLIKIGGEWLLYFSRKKTITEAD